MLCGDGACGAPPELPSPKMIATARFLAWLCASAKAFRLAFLAFFPCFVHRPFFLDIPCIGLGKSPLLGPGEHSQAGRQAHFNKRRTAHSLRHLRHAPWTAR